MGTRYLISGVQLGILENLLKEDTPPAVKTIVEDIYKRQHVGSSTGDIIKDCERLTIRNKDILMKGE